MYLQNALLRDFCLLDLNINFLKILIKRAVQALILQGLIQEYSHFEGLHLEFGRNSRISHVESHSEKADMLLRICRLYHNSVLPVLSNRRNRFVDD